MRQSIEVPGLSHGDLPIPSASRVGQLIATGGVRGVDPANGQMPPDLETQTRLMFENLRRVVEAGGASCDSILKLTIWIAVPEARAAINVAWLRMFPDAHARPARHILNYALPGGMLVQCEALACAVTPPKVASADPLLRRLAGLDACAVSDALDKIGHRGVVLGLAALSAPGRIVGRAVTVKLGPDEGHPAKRHLCTAAVESADSDSIIVIQHNARTDVAGWGGILSLAASERGVAGVVIDGACRDLDESRELELPVYGRNGTPTTARSRIVEVDWNVPVNICGVTVASGDLLIADGSGIVAIPQAQAEAVLQTAEMIVRKEQLMAEAVRRGDPVSQVMGANYENMLKPKS